MLKNLQNKLEDINQKLLPIHRGFFWVLPIILLFSYYPVIPLFSTESSNYEFSLPLLWLLLMGILSLPIFLADLCNLITKKTQLTQTTVQIPLILSSIPLYFSLTLLWSSNKFRGLMTAGIIWCLYLSLLTFYKNIILKKTPLSLEKSFLLGATLASGFCWLQAILNTLNIPGDRILLCLGCTNLSFGFPHPNGFAIEPQFMGNLLLAPAIFLVFRVIHPKTHQTRKSKILYLALAGFVISTLFLIFSRGATYSFFLSVAVIFLYEVFRAKKKPLVASKIVSIILFPLIFVTLAQGLMSEFGPTSDTFLGGVSRSLSQTTLGRIKISLPEAKNPSVTSNESSNLSPNDNANTNVSTNSSPNSTSDAPLFDGYITESTDIRVKLSKMGLQLALSHPGQFFFGSGLGSSGVALYQTFPELGSTKEITQNQYIAILVEAGFIGILIIFCSSICVIYLCYSRQKPIKLSSKQSSKQSMKKSNFTNLTSSITSAKLYFISLILAYAASVCFFSGLPNALHIYLVPVLYPALFAKNFEFL